MKVFSLQGADADLFEIVGNELWLIPNGGIELNRTTLSVSIQVDDASIGASFDDAVVLNIETDQLAPSVPMEPETNGDPETEAEVETENDAMDAIDVIEDNSDQTQLQELVSFPSQTTPPSTDSLDSTVPAQEIDQQAILATEDETEVTDLIVQEASDHTRTFALSEYGELFQQVVGGSTLAIPTVNQFTVSTATLTVSQFGEWTESNSDSALALDQIVGGSSAIATTSLSVGYVIWMLRGGSLFASFVSSLPAWTSFDLLPVLNKFDEESLADIADN